MIEFNKCRLCGKTPKSILNIDGYKISCCDLELENWPSLADMAKKWNIVTESYDEFTDVEDLKKSREEVRVQVYNKVFKLERRFIDDETGQIIISAMSKCMGMDYCEFLGCSERKSNETKDHDYLCQFSKRPDIIDSIVEKVKSKFDHRSRVGLKKYGVGLDRKDIKIKGWAVHAQEECMDNALYLESFMKLLDEMEERIKELELENKTLKNNNQGIEQYDDVAKLCINTYGKDHQIQRMGEECSELAVEIFKRGRKQNGSSDQDIISELADVWIMLGQMMHIYGKKNVLKEVHNKVMRLKMMLDDEKTRNV